MRPVQGGTESADQAARLRELVGGASARRAATVAITSGKGGVGKTNLAVNLAICLASRGLRTTLLDADFGLANADVLLNVQARLNLSHVLSGQCEMGEVLVEAPGGFLLVPGASGLARMANLSTFEQHRLLALLSEIDRSTDVLVIDCGAGISRNVTGMAAVADLCLVTATPEPTAMADAYGMVKVLSGESAAPALGLVVNQCSSKYEAAQTYERVSRVAARFLDLALRDFGYILSDEHVGLAVRQRMPLALRYPRSPAGACVRAIADRVAEHVALGEAPGGFLRRVANLFF